MELGGFAENETVIDGSYEEYLAFNYCMAENYVDAMYGEDFEEIGCLSSDLLNDIIFWINYDKDRNVELQKQIITGEFITIKNRTFIDAILDNNNSDAAFVYLTKNGIDCNEKYIDLFILLILNIDEVYNEKILNSILFSNDYNKNSLSKVLNRLLIMYDNFKDNIDNMDKIRYYLNSINYISDIDKIIIDDILVKEVKNKYFNDKIKKLGSKNTYSSIISI